MSVLRCEPRVVRRLPVALLAAAAGLSVRVLELGVVLQGQAEVRNWSSVWVGLEVLEITGLVRTAVLLYCRSTYLSPVAGGTAVMPALDAMVRRADGSVRLRLVRVPGVREARLRTLVGGATGGWRVGGHRLHDAF